MMKFRAEETSEISYSSPLILQMNKLSPLKPEVFKRSQNKVIWKSRTSRSSGSGSFHSPTLIYVPGSSDDKEICLQCRRPSLDPWDGKIPGERNCNPLQYSCLENSVEKEPGRLLSMESHRVGHDWLTNTHIHTHTHTLVYISGSVFPFWFFSLIVYYKVLSMVLCALSLFLCVYIYTYIHRYI